MNGKLLEPSHVNLFIEEWKVFHKADPGLGILFLKKILAKLIQQHIESIVHYNQIRFIPKMQE